MIMKDADWGAIQYGNDLHNHLADAFAYLAQGLNMSNVESPNHYTQGYMEVIYEIRDTLGAEGFKAFCMGNWMKYNARASHKGLKSEDLAKADQYLEWAANGLPKPVNNRVPRPEPADDLYANFFQATQGPQEPQKPRELQEEPAAKKNSELGDPYGSEQIRARLWIELNKRLASNPTHRPIELQVRKARQFCGYIADLYVSKNGQKIATASFRGMTPSAEQYVYVAEEMYEAILEHYA